jgi:hypothetical protein
MPTLAVGMRIRRKTLQHAHASVGMAPINDYLQNHRNPKATPFLWFPQPASPPFDRFFLSF